MRAAFAALRPPMVHLAAAARARGQADWVVGMNATMALSARHGGLWSAGRVQTPTLALLVAREAEIRGFRPEDYWAVVGDFQVQGARYAGRWFRGDADRLPAAAEAEALAVKVRGQNGRVASIERKRAQEAPPQLYNLTDLQRAANARHGLTATQTLAAAQALYEGGHLTYPRTDSRHVTPEVAGTFPARLRAAGGLPAPLGAIAQRLAGAPPDPGKRVIDAAKVTDHHALLPTAQAPARLSPDEARVYDLVARRFLAALLPPAIYHETDAITEVLGETFRSRSRSLAVPGWREAEPPAQPTQDAHSGAKGGLGGQRVPRTTPTRPPRAIPGVISPSCATAPPSGAPTPAPRRARPSPPSGTPRLVC